MTPELRDERITSVPAFAWRASAVVFGLPVGILLSSGGIVPALCGLALSGAVIFLATKMRVDEDRFLPALTALAMSVHIAAAVVIYAFAPGFGGGFVTGDDAAYFRLSSAAATYVRGTPLDPSQGPPSWNGEAYLFGMFVYLETALFVVFGSDVRVPLLVNAAFGTAVALLTYRVVSRFRAHPAPVIAFGVIAFYPSLILWSSLNLKDALTSLLLVSAISCLVTYQEGRRLGALLVAMLVAESLVTLRSYVATTVGLTGVLAAATANVGPRRRLAALTIATPLFVLVAAQSLSTAGVTPERVLAALERTRSAMAVGANTGFVVTPSATSVPTTSASSAPISQVIDTVAYLPTGLAYALFAPFPWLARRPQELIAAPEMVLWYVLLAAAIVGLWLERRRWRLLAPIALCTVTLGFLLALLEGNVGTLFRHRGMLVPLVATLAAPTLADLYRRVRRRRDRSEALDEGGAASTASRVDGIEHQPRMLEDHVVIDV